jgi:hypothetical protein
MAWVWTRLRFASPGTLAIGAVMCLVAAVVLDRIDPRASFLTGLLFGLAVGLGVFALGTWQRRQAHS